MALPAAPYRPRHGRSRAVAQRLLPVGHRTVTPSPPPADRRHTDLYVGAATFLTQYGLHPDPAAFLSHGYVDLCLAAWPTASGASLDLATRWAVWTWIVDDVFDAEMLGESRQVVGEFALSLVLVASGSTRPAPADHPTLHALADLVADTRAVMPAFWWRRYLTHLEGWVHAASATRRLARSLDHFRHALADWTSSSSRYATRHETSAAWPS
ncbi:hypothetical protein ACFZB9_16550 [Kitasatospora sp. NPDC008050]|uniref:terpene synthase family protein n=1 Tax=Kitasatospora sp. NPDC008050 TaxID=3364021 RepID=UPI0036EEC432